MELVISWVVLMVELVKAKVEIDVDMRGASTSADCSLHSEHFSISSIINHTFRIATIYTRE